MATFMPDVRVQMCRSCTSSTPGSAEKVADDGGEVHPLGHVLRKDGKDLTAQSDCAEEDERSDAEGDEGVPCR